MNELLVRKAVESATHGQNNASNASIIRERGSSLGEEAVPAYRSAASNIDDSRSGSDSETAIVFDQEADQLSRSTAKLRKLRAKATAAASDDPIRDTSQASGSSKYRRAQPIKRYAKERADGVCEACGERAPFNDESGEPYLEIHHVDELGKGGKDHPGKVVALCPTCHKRVHHGEDGQQMNRAIRKKLNNGLGDIGKY